MINGTTVFEFRFFNRKEKKKKKKKMDNYLWNAFLHIKHTLYHAYYEFYDLIGQCEVLYFTY